MPKFAAKQLDAVGDPVYYLVEYEVKEEGSGFIYTGTAYATRDTNKELTEEDEAFRYSFIKPGADWSVINRIEVHSRLGETLAQQIRDTFFRELILNGTMGVEQRSN